ncbi:MAG: sulfate adenylyltransferase, partial [Calditrichia bacterium]|nr:sulfate adenylyltransferase [Calditrichia bacterium]
MIQPHGGKLVNLMVDGAEREKLMQEAESLQGVVMDEYNIADLEMLSSGALSPLTGFMNLKDYGNVIDNVRLGNGTVW